MVRRLEKIRNKQQSNCFSVFTKQWWWTRKNKTTYISKHNSEDENQVIILMVINNQKWLLALKSLSTLLHEITSKHNDDNYCMNSLHSFWTESTLKSLENVYKNYDYCNVKITEAHNIILKVNQDQESMKTPFTIYTGIASGIEAKQSTRDNRVRSGRLAEAIDRNEHGTESKTQ